MRLICTSFLLCLLLASCNEQTDSYDATDFITGIEKAHKKDLFMEQEAIQCDILLTFGENERLNGTLTLLTNSKKGRIDYKDGRILIYNDGQVYYSSKVGDAERAEFDAYTWSYFLLMPYKLSDPGAIWENYSNKELKGKVYDVHKLTFEEGTGGSPDDWYIVYRDPQSHLLHSAAYIVTANKEKEEAEKDPHAIEYLSYREVEGVPMASEWKFWAWRPGKGFTKKLGHAELDRIRFTQLNEGFFEPLPGMLQTEQ